MRNVKLEQLTVEMVSEYYKGNNEPLFQYAADDILWLGPRTGQMILSRDALVSFFSASSTALSFEIRGLTAYDMQTGPGRWEIILQFRVTTIFPSGEMHEHNQRMQFSWGKSGKQKKDAGIKDRDAEKTAAGEDSAKNISAKDADTAHAALRPDYVVHVLNIGNIGSMEEMALYARTPDESAEDASFVHTPGQRGPVCIFPGMKDDTHYLSVNEILYIESESRARHSIIHLSDPHTPLIHCREGLHTIEKKYPDIFFRTHISYLINPLYVTETSRFKVRLLNGETLPIPEKKYTAVKEALRQKLDTYFPRMASH